MEKKSFLQQSLHNDVEIPKGRSQHLTQLFSAMALIVVGCGLLIGAFFVPPTGVIDSSVLIGFGEILTFAGTLFGIDYRYKFKSSRV